MSVPFTNVTLMITQIVQAKLSDNTLDNPALTHGNGDIQGYLLMLTPTQAYSTFNVELRNPASLDLNISDASFYDMSDTTVSEYQVEVTSAKGAGALTGTCWRIVGRPEIYDDNLPCDHAEFLLEQMTYQL